MPSASIDFVFDRDLNVIPYQIKLKVVCRMVQYPQHFFKDNSVTGLTHDTKNIKSKV